ncbi:MAG: hypothetical protein MK179_14125 [Pirellulaceae bacterium]|nr:hypothetical protein [Pirellulaceae bacterium]
MSNGHGSENYTITITLFPEQGHAIFYAEGESTPSAEELPQALGQALQSWMGDNPAVVVRSSLPIVQNGHTIAIHLWFDPATIEATD